MEAAATSAFAKRTAELALRESELGPAGMEVTLCEQGPRLGGDVYGDNGQTITSGQTLRQT